MSAHPTDWNLRRLHAGELSGAEGAPLRAHAAGCERCGARLRSLEEEQRGLEASVPFERFAAGVERAARPSSAATRARPPWLAPLGALAACALLVVVAVPHLGDGGAGTRTKGGASMELVVAGTTGPQRTLHAGARERLAPGERVRIGYAAAGGGYVLVLSVDAAGAVTPLYPEAGTSLAAHGGAGTHFLPDSLEFTGAGAERVVVVLSPSPLEVAQVRAAAERAFRSAGGDVTAMGALDVPGEQAHWVLFKP